MKVLFAASECVPFVKTGGLADVVGALPKRLRDLGADVRVMLFVLEKILDTDGRVRLIEQTAAKDRRMVARLLGE